MTLESVNAGGWAPRKDHASGRLLRGALQLPPGALLLLDETQMAAGAVGEAGVRSLQALGRVLAEQQLPVDFEFYQVRCGAARAPRPLPQWGASLRAGAGIGTGRAEPGGRARARRRRRRSGRLRRPAAAALLGPLCGRRRRGGRLARPRALHQTPCPPCPLHTTHSPHQAPRPPCPQNPSPSPQADYPLDVAAITVSRGRSLLRDMHHFVVPLAPPPAAAANPSDAPISDAPGSDTDVRFDASQLEAVRDYLSFARCLQCQLDEPAAERLAAAFGDAARAEPGFDMDRFNACVTVGARPRRRARAGPGAKWF